MIANRPPLFIIDDPWNRPFVTVDLCRNLYRGPDPTERAHFDPPPKPSHKLSPLDRAQQGRAARRDTIGRAR